MRSDAFWAFFEAHARARLKLRGATFALIFEYLDRFDRPVSIVETGCARQEGILAGAAGSTLLFDKYAEYHPGTTIYTVDIDDSAANACRTLVSHRVTIATGDSVAFLAGFARSRFGSSWPIDLLYLDSSELHDSDPAHSAWHHMKELAAVLPAIDAQTLVVVDGSPTALQGVAQDGGGFVVVGRPRIGGKGKLIAEYAEQVGAAVHLHGYQAGWTGLGRAVRHGAAVRAIVTQTEQGLFAVGAEDAFVGGSLREYGSYGVREIERAAAFVTSNDDVLVVGGHVGSIAIPLARKCRHLTVVEANPWTYKLLQCNLVLNDACNVTAHHFAAGDREGSVRFVMNTHNSGGSKRYPLKPNPAYFLDNPVVTAVDCFRLDERLDRHDYRLVFMDIEGSEYSAILGMPRILSFAQCLIVEFLPHHLTDVAGIGPEDFAAALAPYFATMFVPGLGRSVNRDAFALVLREMFDRGEGDAGLVFTK